MSVEMRAGQEPRRRFNLSNEVAGQPAPSVTEAEHGSDHTGKRVLSHSTEKSASTTPTLLSSCHRRRRHKPPLLPRRSSRRAGVVTGKQSSASCSARVVVAPSRRLF